MPKYIVTVPFEGTISVEVEANSADEAMAMVNHEEDLEITEENIDYCVFGDTLIAKELK